MPNKKIVNFMQKVQWIIKGVQRCFQGFLLEISKDTSILLDKVVEVKGYQNVLFEDN